MTSTTKRKPARKQKKSRASYLRYVTFWTPDFALAANRLRATAKHFNVDFYDEMMVKKDNWRGMVRCKPRFIYAMMKKFKKTNYIAWIDADAMFRRKPVNLGIGTQDIFYKTVKFKKRTEPVASLIIIKNSIKMRAFVKQWMLDTERLKPETKRPEQRTLAALLVSKRGIKKGELPDGLVAPKWIFPNTDGYDKSKASIWTTRWMRFTPEELEKHAYTEKEARENGTWRAKDWTYRIPGCLS